MNCRAKPRREEGAGRDHHHPPQGARGKKNRAGPPPPANPNSEMCFNISKRLGPPPPPAKLFLISALFPTCDGSRAGPALQQGLCLWRAAGYRFYCYDNRFMTRRGRHPQEPTDGIAIAVCWSFELTKALVRPEIPCQEIVLGRLL